MKRHLITALIATFVLSAVSGIGIASAQTVPAGHSTTVAQAVQPTPAAKVPAKKKPLVVLHLTPLSTYNVGTSDLPRPTSSCADNHCGPSGNYQFAEPITHLGYGAQIFLSPKWNINYSHSYIDQNIGRVTNVHNAYTYQVLNDDRTDDAALNYLAGSVTLSGGWHERVRMCCGNNAPQSAPKQTAYHYDYLQAATRFGTGSKNFGKMFGFTLQDAYILHAVPAPGYAASPYCTGTAAECVTPAFGAVPFEGNKTKITYTGNITVPIGDPHTSSFALFATYLNNFDYFDNAPVMYLYNQVDYGFIKKFSPWVTLTANNSNLYQHQQGYPFVLPNTINRNKLIVTLDIGLPVY